MTATDSLAHHTTHHGVGTGTPASPNQAAGDTHIVNYGNHHVHRLVCKIFFKGTTEGKIGSRLELWNRHQMLGTPPGPKTSGRRWDPRWPGRWSFTPTAAHRGEDLRPQIMPESASGVRNFTIASYAVFHPTKPP